MTLEIVKTITNADFREQLKLCYISNSITSSMEVTLMVIAEKLSRHEIYKDYSKEWKEKMVGDAYNKMLLGVELKKFQLDSDNGWDPLNYFTIISWNAFNNIIKKEKKLWVIILQINHPIGMGQAPNCKDGPTQK